MLYYLPFFNIMRVPSRFTVLVMLALAVLVGYGLAAAAAVRAGPEHRTFRLGARSFALAPHWALVGALVIFEYLAIPYPMQVLNYDEPLY